MKIQISLSAKEGPFIEYVTPGGSGKPQKHEVLKSVFINDDIAVYVVHEYAKVYSVIVGDPNTVFNGVRTKLASSPNMGKNQATEVMKEAIRIAKEGGTDRSKIIKEAIKVVTIKK